MKFSSTALVCLSTAAISSAFVPGAIKQPPFLGVSKPSSASTASFLQRTSTSLRDAETYEFTSDVGRVMDLIINSLYSDRDIFLRELVSNAADACDKRRFLSITAGEDSTPPEIKITCNRVDNTITIQDSGVGMTKDELKNNLGKIANSGTRAFQKALGEGSADVNLIGQFGVGFYSAYLVADKVTVYTKSMQDGSQGYKWESAADSSYTIEEVNDDDVHGIMETCGTKLILTMKDDANEYLDGDKIELLLKRYSEFIEFPISVWKQTTEYKQVLDEEANSELAEGEEPKMKTFPETKEGFERVNNQKPIWLRPVKDVTVEEYMDFYKSAFKTSYDEPMKYTHFVLEGQVECKAILYIPGTLPFELSRDMFDENSLNIRLYVKRVFINDKFDELLPRWLKFVKGVVDSDDLPLNVSREILQKSKVLSIINKRMVRKVLDMIRDISEGEDGMYVLFWNNFGKYLKVGIIEDDKNRKEIAPLLRFFSAMSGEEYTSLDAYIKAMPEKQKSIYYVTGDGREKAGNSPVVEKLTSRGYDVLLATEPLDEIMFESLREFKDKSIVDAAKEGLKLDDEENEDSKKKKEAWNREYREVIGYLETLLKGQVEKVAVSDLLTGSPAALVQGAYGMSPTMQRYMRAQAVASGQDMAGLDSMNRVIMEINPKHPIIRDLDAMVKTDKEAKKTEDFANLVYDVAGMTSGYEVKDMAGFAQRVMGMMSGNVSNLVQDAEIEKEEETKVANVEVVE